MHCHHDMSENMRQNKTKLENLFTKRAIGEISPRDWLFLAIRYLKLAGLLIAFAILWVIFMVSLKERR